MFQSMQDSVNSKCLLLEVVLRASIFHVVQMDSASTSPNEVDLHQGSEIALITRGTHLLITTDLYPHFLGC